MHTIYPVYIHPEETLFTFTLRTSVYTQCEETLSPWRGHPVYITPRTNLHLRRGNPAYIQSEEPFYIHVEEILSISLRGTILHLRWGNPVYIEAEETLSTVKKWKFCLHSDSGNHGYIFTSKQGVTFYVWNIMSAGKGGRRHPLLSEASIKSRLLISARVRLSHWLKTGQWARGDAGRISGGLSLIVFDWSLPPFPHAIKHTDIYWKHGEIKEL